MGKFVSEIVHHDVFECLVLTILTLTKYLQNLLRESALSEVSAANKILFQVVLIMLKMPSKTFLWMTCYQFLCMGQAGIIPSVRKRPKVIWYRIYDRNVDSLQNRSVPRELNSDPSRVNQD